MTLTSTVNPTVAGQPTTLTATVGAPSVPPAGTINLFDGATQIDTATVSATGAGNTTGIGNSLALGDSHSCVVTAAGGVKCWGYNHDGQLGNGGPNDSLVPIDVSGLSGVRAIAAGILSTCALIDDGTVKCWGSAPNGSNGFDGTAPFTLAGVSNARMIVESGLALDVVCVVTTAGAVRCAGANSFMTVLATTTISGLESGVSSVALNASHACAVMVDGSIKCWGGSQGPNAAPSGATPTTITGFPAGAIATAVTAGFDFSCALLNTPAVTGAVWCWGRNDEGELGNGTSGSNTTTIGVPVDTGLSNVKAISAGTIHVCALISDGTMKCWGDSSTGAVGDIFVSQINVPDTVINIPAVSAIAAGDRHTCAITTAGVTKCWGTNTHGQIGNNTSDSSAHPVPTDVSGPPSIKLYGQVTSSLGFLTAGSHTLTATFVPSNPSLFNSGSSAPLTQTVNQSATTTTLSFVSGTNPSKFGDALSFGVVVAPASPGNGTPTGTVNLMDGSEVVATGTLSSGQITFPISTLTLGTHTITAAYQGDANYTASTSSSRSQTVSTADTLTALTTSGSPSISNHSVTFTATVTSQAGTPTGTVSFKDNGNEIGTGTLSGGVATFSTSSLAVGNHPIRAAYQGDGTYLTSTSSPDLTQSVTTTSSSTSLTTSGSPSAYGHSVTFTATVSSAVGNPPTGTVAFKDGVTQIGTGTLSGGIATFSTAALNAGAHMITAAYAGEGGYQPSTSNTVTQTVQQGSSTTTLVAGPNAPAPGDSIRFTATVQAAAPAIGTPTGSITLKVDNVTVATASLSSGQVVWRQKLAAGSHSVTAAYAGDINFSASTSSPVTVSTGTTKAATATTLTALSPSSNSYGNTTSVRVEVSTAGGGPATGSVTIKDGGTTLATVNLDAFNPSSAVSAGGLISCMIGASGGAKCWGRQSFGMLGDDVGDASFGSHPTPVDVSGLTSGVQSIMAQDGGGASCAVTAVGGLKCWGENAQGSLGNGTTDPAPQPGDAHLPNDVIALTTGVSSVSYSNDTCALTTSGGVKCWGINNRGSLGTDDATSFATGTPVDVVGLDSGVKTLGGNCAIMTSGGVKCWGDNSVGEFGTGTSDFDTHPVTDVAGVSDAVAIAEGAAICAVIKMGGVKCWGSNLHGELGLGSADSNIHGPTDAPELSDVVQISSSSSNFCGATSGGAVKCWGGLGYMIGDGSFSAGAYPPTVVPMVETAVAVSVGADHVCALTTTGALKCWGSNVYGQLGVPTIQPVAPNFDLDVRTTPVDAQVPAIPLRTTVTFSTTALGGGNRSLTAIYNGDDAHTGSTSGSLTQTVLNAPTTTTLASSVNPSVTGQQVNLTATIASTGVPSGSVTFKEGTTTLGSAPVSGGQASLPVSSLAFGSHDITASYNGDAFFNASSTVTALTQFVKGTTTLTASATPSTAKPGEAVALTANVAAAASVTATGSVTFKDGSTTLGSGTIASGTAQLSTSSLTLGNHVITASYGGDGNLAGSSATTNVKVSGALGPETKVNTTTKGAQQFPAVAALKRGYVIAWASKGEDKSGYGVYLQRYTSGGAKVGAETLVNTDKTGDQTMPAVAGLPSGDFVVVWQSVKQDTSGLGIYSQIFKSNGKKSGVEFKVNATTTGDQSLPSVAATADGGFVVAWTSNGRDGSGLGIYAQCYDATGKAAGTEFKANKTTAGDQSNAVVAGLSGGGFVIAWQGPDADGLGIYMQRYDAAGKAQGRETLVNKTTLNDQSLPTIAALASGGFVVAWQSTDASGLGVSAQRYSATGVRTGGEVHVNTTTVNDQGTPSVAGFSNGGYVIAWTSNLQDGSGQGVYAQAFTDDGARVNAEFPVNTTTADDQNQPAAAAFASGNFVVVWTSANDGGGQGIYSQRFLVPGTN